MAELRTIITLRHGTTEEWGRSIVILAKGEAGVEYLPDGNTRIKFGDGASSWAELPYAAEDELLALKNRIATEEGRAKESELSLLASIEQNAAGIKTINEEAIPQLQSQLNKVDNTLNLILSNDQEGIDSIKELATWIAEHGAEAAEFASEINKLNGLVGTVPVVEQIAAVEATLRADAKEKLLSKEEATARYTTRKFEVTDLPKGTLVNYGEREIRIMCPTNAEFVKQSVGPTGNADNYYMTFKVYAPNDKVAGYIEHLGNQHDEEIQTKMSVDKYGRKYQTTWLALARYDATTNTWTYYGANSTAAKYIGWNYRIDWYDADGNLIDKSAVRINLSNENCHDNEEPYYLNQMVVGATVGDKLVEVKNRKLVIPVGAGIKDSDEISMTADGILSIKQLNVNKLIQTEDLILNGGTAVFE